jgi:hypothetical protein
MPAATARAGISNQQHASTALPRLKSCHGCASAGCGGADGCAQRPAPRHRCSLAARVAAADRLRPRGRARRRCSGVRRQLAVLPCPPRGASQSRNPPPGPDPACSARLDASAGAAEVCGECRRPPAGTTWAVDPHHISHRLALPNGARAAWEAGGEPDEHGDLDLSRLPEVLRVCLPRRRDAAAAAQTAAGAARAASGTERLPLLYAADGAAVAVADLWLHPDVQVRPAAVAGAGSSSWPSVDLLICRP